MIIQNLHTHTIFDDGKSTVMEMAQAAYDAGLTSLGFSGHSILPYQNEWAMTYETQKQYIAFVRRAREVFGGKLEVFCGLEWDLLSAPPEGFDYVIGSIHHIASEDEIIPVDESPKTTKNALERFFGNDPDAFAEAFFSRYEALAQADFVDIVGHFDLLTKFDEKAHIFRPDSPRYADAAIAALETLVKADKIFEVNTGAIGRGWRSSPYPSEALLRELRERNARVLVTSDAHSTDGIACAFPETEEMLKAVGFREIWMLTGNGFSPAKL